MSLHDIVKNDFDRRSSVKPIPKCVFMLSFECSHNFFVASVPAFYLRAAIFSFAFTSLILKLCKMRK